MFHNSIKLGHWPDFIGPQRVVLQFKTLYVFSVLQ